MITLLRDDDGRLSGRPGRNRSSAAYTSRTLLGCGYFISSRRMMAGTSPKIDTSKCVEKRGVHKPPYLCHSWSARGSSKSLPNGPLEDLDLYGCR